ncbi:MAG: hypothetical protein MR582_07665 [Campylobacter sp.]|nr:hypothetical protein [Campylobacter sp.]
MFVGIESFLKKATNSKISSVNFGFLTTAIMQSSGLVSVLTSSNSKKEDMGKFMDLQRVELLLAEALKYIKNSQPNVYKFITSNNPYIKAEYDKLRIKLLKSLSIMTKMANLKDDYDLKTELKELKEIYNDYNNDELALDTLLCGKKISNTMAASLMNDTALIHGF